MMSAPPREPEGQDLKDLKDLNQNSSHFENAVPPPPSGTLGSTSTGQFTCQWTDCGENLSSPDTLYVSASPTSSLPPPKQIVKNGDIMCENRGR